MVTDGWRQAVEEHRDALEALAACGKTQLAQDAQTLLDEAGAGGEDG